jgi:hypothetical protein
VLQIFWKQPFHQGGDDFDKKREQPTKHSTLPIFPGPSHCALLIAPLEQIPPRAPDYPVRIELHHEDPDNNDGY